MGHQSDGLVSGTAWQPGVQNPLSGQVDFLGADLLQLLLEQFQEIELPLGGRAGIRLLAGSGIYPHVLILLVAVPGGTDRT